MTARKTQAASHDFPAGMSQPSLRALASAGYTHLEQLTRATEAELLALHGMGPKGIRILKSALAERRLALAEARTG
jgi:DNA-directed RNA polymerase alpha subunit